MPPKVPRGAAAKAVHKQALRASRGGDDNAVVTVAQSTNVTTVVHAESRRLNIFPQVKSMLELFLPTLAQHVSFSDIFAPRSTYVLTYGFLTAFLLFWGRHTFGQGISGSLKRQQAVWTHKLRWFGFKALYIEETGQLIDSALSSKVSAFISDGQNGLKKLLDLSDSTSFKPWLDIHVLNTIASACLSPFTRIRDTRSRISMLLWLSITIHTALRVGALFKGDKRFKKQNHLLWSDLTLCVFKGDVKNRLGLKFVAPNGKTSNSTDILVALTDQSPTWCNAVHWVLALADIAGTFPSGWTREQLLDPNSLAPGESLRALSFDGPNSSQPVFLTEQSGGRPYIPWTTHTIRKFLSRVTRNLGYDHAISPHVLRKSVAIALKLAGARFVDISRQLKHAFNSTVWENYIGGVITTSVSAALFSGTHDVPIETLAVHPDRVKKLAIGKRQLTPQIYRIIYDKEHISELIDEYTSKKTDYKAAEGVSQLSELSVGARQDIQSSLEVLGRALRKQIDYYCKLVEAGEIDIYGRPLTSTANAQAALAEDHLDEDDQDLQGIDAVEDEEGSEFLSDHEGDCQDKDEDEDDQDDHEEEDEVQDEDEEQNEEDEDDVDDDDIDVEGIELYQTTVDDTDTGRLLADIVAADDINEVQFAQVANHPSVMEAFQDPTGSIFAVNTAGTDDSAPPSAPLSGPSASPEDLDLDIGSLSRLHRLVFSEECADMLAVLQGCASVPAQTMMSLEFRLGHAPIDGKCPFCHELLEPIPPRGDPGRKNWHDKILSHVNACGAKSFVANLDKATLVARYPSTIQHNPVSSFKHKQEFLGRINNTIGQTFKDKVRKKKRICDMAWPRCTLCPKESRPELKSSSQVREHVLKKHQSYIPTQEIPKPSTTWSADTVVLPKPIFYSHLQRYIVDPMEQMTVAEGLYQKRIVNPCANTTGYGFRTDVTIPNGILLADRKEMTKADGSKSCYPADDKYDLKHDPSASSRAPPISDGFCIICVNDDRFSMVQRMMPHNTSEKHHKDHFKTCLRSLFQTIDGLNADRVNGLANPLRCTPWWSDGKLLCLDPVCKANKREFTDKLEFANHLAAVHRSAPYGITRLQLLPELGSFTWVDTQALEAEQEEWTADKREEKYPKKKRGQQAEAPKKGVRRKRAGEKARKARETLQKDREGKGKGRAADASVHEDEEEEEDEEEDHGEVEDGLHEESDDDEPGPSTKRARK